MSLFPKKNPFSIRNNYVEPGQIVYCEICYRYLPAGTTYDPSHPRCHQCYYA